MRRKNRGNKIVKRAIMLAMAFMMGFTAIPNTAFAAENTNVALEQTDGGATQENGGESTDTPSADTDTTTPAATEATGTDAEAQDALDAASQAAGEVKKDITPAITIGSGIVSQETMNKLADIEIDERNAIVGDNNAKDDIDDIDEIVKDAQTQVDQATEEVGKNADKIDEIYSNATETNAETGEETNKNQQAAEQAKDAANAAAEEAIKATTSTEASQAATTAGQEAAKADAAATQAEKDAADAKAEYDAATEKYNEAVKAAEEAQKEAEEKKAAGAADAAEAVKAAEAALQNAKDIQVEVQKAKEVAGEKCEAIGQELDTAKEKLAKARQDFIEYKTGQWDDAQDNAITTGNDLLIADGLLVAADAVVGLETVDVAYREAVIKNLEDTKEAAEKELARREAELNDLKSAAKADENELAQKQVEYDTLKSAVDASESALAEAKASLEDLKAANEKANQEFNEIKTKVESEGYDKTVYDAEKIIAESDPNTEEGKKAIENAKDALVYAVISNEIVKGDASKKVEKNADGYYVVTTTNADGTETTKYYNYVIDTDGSIKVYDYNYTNIEKGTSNIYTSESEANASVVGMATGEDYNIEHKDAEYTVTYDATNLSIRNLTSAAKKDKNLQNMTIKVKYYKLGSGYVEAYATWNSKLKCYMTDDKLVISDALLKVKIEDVSADNVTASELSNYVGSYSSTKTADESWTVTYLKDITGYALTDDIVDGSKTSVLNDYNSKKAAAQETAQKLADTQNQIEILNQEIPAKKAEADEAQKKVEEAQKEVDKAQKAVDKAQAKYDMYKEAYDDYYENGKITINLFGKDIVIDNSKYAQDKAKAEAELLKANAKLKLAKEAQKEAKANQQEKEAAHKAAVAELAEKSEVLKELGEDYLAAGVVVIAKTAEYESARAAYEALKIADNYATDLEKQCQEAYDAAVAAKAAVDNIKTSVDISELQKKYDDAKTKYEKLKEAAEAARKAANEALQAYQTALQKVEELVNAEEEAKRSQDNSGNSDSANGGSSNGSSSNSGSAAAASYVTIATESVPLAGPTSLTDAGTTTISDSEVPLAGPKTDDSNSLLLYMGALAAGLAVFGAGYVTNRKKKED